MAGGSKKKKTTEASRAQGPYRQDDRRSEPAESDGLVGDLVRQFADPYALYRELAQNAIDAGATEIHVRVVITREGERAEARIAVSDDGCGMTQSVLEEDLVVLFRSTKDERTDSIGKFGIGFVSVLAIGPSLVAVSTCVGDGMRHVLHLHPDRSYDLYREPGGTRGTTVTLHVPLEDDGSELVLRSRAALDRWCGHAGVPIHFTVVGVEGDAPSGTTRIDRPLEIAEALVSVASVSHDGHAEALVALVPEAARLAAYYNRGLLLHASRDRGTRASIAFKVSDRRLSHTLSREDVRLDEAHARALRLVEHTIAVPLRAETIDAIVEAAHAVTRGEPEAGARWLALVTAARSADVLASDAQVAVPLIAPIGGSRVAYCLDAREVLLIARERDALADLLAERGTPVIDGRIADDEAGAATIDALLKACSGRAPVDPHTIHAALVPHPSTDVDASLLARISALLGAALRTPSSVHFVDVVGADPRLSFALAHVDRPHLAGAREQEADPFRLVMRPPLGIAATHPLVSLARAHPDAVLAADVIARAVLVDRDLATEPRSRAIADASLRALFAGDAS